MWDVSHSLMINIIGTINLASLTYFLDLSVYLMVYDRYFIISIVCLLSSRWQLEFCTCSSTQIAHKKSICHYGFSQLKNIQNNNSWILLKKKHFYVVQAKWRIWKEFKWFFHGELRYFDSSFLSIHLLILLVLFIWHWQFLIGVLTVKFIHVCVKKMIRDLFSVYFWFFGF